MLETITEENLSYTRKQDQNSGTQASRIEGMRKEKLPTEEETKRDVDKRQ